MEKINVVVVGYGGMGGYHADRILEMEKFNLLGIYDIKEERRKAEKGKERGETRREEGRGLLRIRPGQRQRL